MNAHPTLSLCLMIGSIVFWAAVGDVLTASAMRNLGDLDDIRAARGLTGAIAAVLGNLRFIAGVICMSLSFFSLLFALSQRDLSLIGPAAASLTFVANAVAAKFFLGEKVDHRRWLAAIFVCIGVALLAH
jgi:drug/metabolite transporter (DMT)-like permease